MNQTSLLAQIASLIETPSPSKQVPSWYRPVIAVPATSCTSLYGRWRMQGVEEDIGRALEEAGADPSYFPCRPLRSHENAFLTVWQVLRRADGILLPGGVHDVLPGWFITSPRSLVGTAAWWEDWWRWHLTQLSLLLCLPFLGIDLGAGYLNVVLGGTLYSDIRTGRNRFGKHQAAGQLNADKWIFNALEVLVPEGKLGRCAQGVSPIWGACMHHVAVAGVAPDLVVSARSQEGCAEVLERHGPFFGVATQGHPEQRDLYADQPYSRNLFALFREYALLYASSRRAELESRCDEIGLYLRSAPSPQLIQRAEALPAETAVTDSQASLAKTPSAQTA